MGGGVYCIGWALKEKREGKKGGGRDWRARLVLFHLFSFNCRWNEQCQAANVIDASADL